MEHDLLVRVRIEEFRAGGRAAAIMAKASSSR